MEDIVNPWCVRQNNDKYKIIYLMWLWHNTVVCRRSIQQPSHNNIIIEQNYGRLTKHRLKVYRLISINVFASSSIKEYKRAIEFELRSNNIYE